MLTTHFSESDSAFSVRAYSAPNRHGNPQHRVKYWTKGQPPLYETAKSPEDAVRLAAAIWRGHLDGLLSVDAPSVPKTVSTLVERFSSRSTLSPATKRSYEQALGMFVDFIGPDRELSAIGKAAIDKFMTYLSTPRTVTTVTKDGREVSRTVICKPVSRQSYLRSLSAMFKWALKEKMIKNDPTAEVKVTLARSDHRLRPWMQAEEWPAFLAACEERDPHHRIRAEFVLHVGLRASELAAAQWSWIIGTGDKKSISVPASKSARARAIPLDRRALVLLDQAKAFWADPNFIFAKGQISPANFRRDTVDACVAASVTTTDFHGLRRSCGSHWLACGVDLFLVSRWLGHADVSTTAKHYAGLADSLSQAGMAKVNDTLT